MAVDTEGVAILTALVEATEGGLMQVLEETVTSVIGFIIDTLVVSEEGTEEGTVEQLRDLGFSLVVAGVIAEQTYPGAVIDVIEARKAAIEDAS